MRDLVEFYNELSVIKNVILEETKDQTEIDNIYIRNRYHNIFCVFEYVNDASEFNEICIGIKSKYGVYNNTYADLMELTDVGLFAQKYKNLSDKCQSKIIIFLNACRNLFEEYLKPTL